MVSSRGLQEVTPNHQPDLPQLERALGIALRNEALLLEALVHSSYLNEHPESGLASNERLEFLGDAVLQLVVTRLLFEENPTMSEGELTLLRGKLVCRETLARWAAELDLGRYLLVGRGEAAQQGQARKRTLAAVMEAIVGAVYLDGGLGTVAPFVERMARRELGRIASVGATKDAKSALQEWLQRERGQAPSYRVVAVAGPDHARDFTVEVLAGQEVLAAGSGRTKRAAEQEAARRAFLLLSEGVVDTDSTLLS